MSEHYVANDHEWASYKVKFGKNYQAHEEASKRQAWEESVKKVNAHNQEHKEGKHSFTMGINQFSDGTNPATGIILPVVSKH